MTTTQITRPSQSQFEQLFQRSCHHAYIFAYRMTGNATDAEDITQDAYVRAWHHFDSYEPARSFEGWLFRIITNLVIDLCRRQKRRQVYSLDMPTHQDAGGQSMVYEYADPAANPEEIVVAPVLEERLEAALRALPAEYWAAILLCDVEQCSYQEVADRMHCVLGKVRSRIHRARLFMRHYLETDDNTPTALHPTAMTK